MDRSFLFQYLKTDIGKIHVSSYVDDAMHVTIGLGIKLYLNALNSMFTM